jgi:signal transduction histidine kinase
MGISSRLLLLLAIPLTVLMVVTGFGVHRGVTQSGAAAELRDRTDLGLSASALVDDLQAERALLVAEDRTTPELRSAVAAGSEALAAQGGRVGGALGAATAAALERVGAADSVAERELGGAVALRVYSEAISDLLDLSTVAIDPRGVVDDAEATTADYLARAQAASAEERDLVTVLSQDGTLDPQSFQEVMSLASAQRSYALLAAATAPAELSIQIRQTAFAMSAADTLRRSVFEGETIRTTTWIEGLDERTSDLSALHRTAESAASAAVDALARDSRLLLAGTVLGAVAIVLVSALLLRRAIDSIARPLQQLANQAEEVAHTRLPEAVEAQQVEGAAEVHLPVIRATGAAEVHDVASAFNDVQVTALRLASEQAALRHNQAEALTNLGRRNQTLLARQLDFISSLETRETDPVFLEHLFKLDHLASRMRRNAESLLILAGSETPRRRRTPAPISEIVRAAMSEVEEFERVRIGNVRDATITGPAVIDVIHLLAELIENALGFSPPDTTVEIDGRSLGQGGYQFAIIDHGVGMTDVELVAANQRLRGLDELEGMPTRYLGQYVVAKLAAKTGAMVRLQPSSGGRGVTALVILPTSALVGGLDRSAVAQPLPGSRAAREQGPVPFAPGAPVAEGVAELAEEPPVTETSVVETTTFEAAALEQTPFEETQFEEPPFEAAALEQTPFEPATPDAVAPEEDLSDAVAPVSGLGDALPWFAGPAQVEPNADPWQEFLADDQPVESPVVEPTAAPVAPLAAALPPPAPPTAPVQPDWAPASAGAVLASEELPQDVPSSETRSGGLAKRIPGATLAESRGHEVGPPTPAAPGRSADAVRSMLSSFQAGRHRGRGSEDGHGEPSAPSSPHTDAGFPASDDPNTVQDGRSPQ